MHFILLLSSTCFMHFLAVDFVSSCVTPERDATFGDFATRSDVVLQAKVVNVGARISSKGMYAARFQVTGLFLTKRGDYAVGDFLNLWPFGNNPNCVAVKINSQHILFLKEVEGKIKNKPLYKLRYNPVPLIKRNLVFFSRFLEGKREALLDEEKLISHNELINGSENFSLKQEKDIPTPHAFISSTVGQQVTTTQAAQQQQDISEEKKLPLSSDLLLGCPIYNGTVYINSIWRGGFGGYVYFPSSSQTIKNGWLVKIDFNIPVTDLKTYTVHVREAEEKFFEFCLTPKYYSRNIYKHQTTTISFVGKYKYTDSLPQISGQSKLFGVCDSAKTYEVYKTMGYNQAYVIDNVMKSCLGARMTSTQVQEETKTTTSYLNNSDKTTEILTTAFVPTPSSSLSTTVMLTTEPETEVSPELETEAPIELQTEALSKLETEAPIELQTEAPSKLETEAPIELQTEAPSKLETEAPIELQTEAPSKLETEAPIELQTEAPSKLETEAPIELQTEAPSKLETEAPLELQTEAPSKLETEAPIELQTEAPSKLETEAPIELQTEAPSKLETEAPIELQTEAPSKLETEAPLELQTEAPSKLETEAPIELQTEAPSKLETEAPIELQTEAPSKLETEAPIELQTEAPSKLETEAPIELQTEAPSKLETEAPIELQTEALSKLETETPLELQTETPSKLETETPLELQTEAPSKLETETPLELQTEAPSKLETEFSLDLKRCNESFPNGISPVGGETLVNWIPSKDKTQRSGRLPEDNRIPWRGDSDLKDGCLTNDDLSGGWYNAGGNVKTTFLIAFSTTMLSWGALDYSAAYQAAGEMENVLAQIRWATDYLMKCHLMKNTLVVQVGRYIPNSLSWQPPELSDPEMRTIIKSTPETPDCKTTAEVAAAFAAASLVFKTHDLSYSRECLNRARELFNFSEKYKEIKETHNINTFYRKKENGTLKVIAWAATWLHKATGDQKYLVRVEDLYRTFRKQSNIFSWDDKSRGLAVLLGKLSNKPQKYKRIISRYIKWVQDTARKTPSGLLWIIRRTPTMHAANAAFLTLQAIELSENQTIKRQYHSFAEKQINLLLGLNQTGYVVGIGSNAPKRPHHRASTCPLPPANCSRSVLDQEQPNAHILYGALVNGPDRNGRFPDKAYDIAHSRVGIDFNAGFQSLAAGLKYYQMSLL
ncbi:uncharacterized protein LOC143461127 isoform X2 [Clavelina lepadiformis]|uniref:uncharacterized protein LOC143461127 isoform X2 n=1 Tax=Clavelina lepadiformis TaxID=159417 RepID=UPI004041E949